MASRRAASNAAMFFFASLTAAFRAPAEAGALVERKQAGDAFEARGIGEQAERETAQSGRGPGSRHGVAFLQRGAGVLDERAVADTRGTHRLARAAREAAV